MRRLLSTITAATLAAALGVGCSTSPTDANSPVLTNAVPPGDGTVGRMALAPGPLGIAVSPAGFAFVTQADFGNSPGTLARVDLTAHVITTTIPVGMVPSLVILNSTQTRAYVSNQWSDNIGVIDVASNTQVDVIPTTGDPFALALSPDGSTILVTTNANQLFKIDVASKSVVGAIALPATSHHILMDAHGRFLYVATRDGGTVMEVDWRSMTVRRTFTFGGRTQDMAFAPDGEDLYVANELNNVVHDIDLAAGTSRDFPLAGGGEGLALGDGGKQLYVGLVFAGEVQVLDRPSGTTVRLIPVGGVPREIALDYNGKDVLVSNDGGWMDFIEPSDSLVPAPPPPPPPPPPDTGFAHVALPDGALGVAVFSNFAYLSQVNTNQVARLELASNTVSATAPAGSVPCILVFNSTGTRAYVANLSSDNVSVIDVATSSKITDIPVTGDPLPVAISPDNSTLFVTTNANQLFRIDLATNTVTGSLPLPATSHHLLAHPNGNLLYVATRDGGSVLEVNWHTMTVARTFTLGGRPQAMALAADQSTLYVANEISNQLQIITLATGAINAVPLASGGEGLALGGDGKLYVSLVFSGQAQVVDPVSRTVVRTLTLGGLPREVAADPARNQVLVANQNGWVDIIHSH